MQTACPACGKLNDLPSAPLCGRCGCDLSPLALILTGAAWHLQAAVCHLRAQDWKAALAHAERSWSLRHSPPAARAACLAAMALGLGNDLLRWRRRASASRF